MINFEGLTPEQRQAIVDLNRRIQSLESKLVVLQAQMAKVDPSLAQGLVRRFKAINLN